MKSDQPEIKRLLFSPAVINDENPEMMKKIMDELALCLNSFSNQPRMEYLDYEMSFDDWNLKQCIRAVIPPHLNFSGYAQIGHIVQLNLREELLPYRFTISEILLEKISAVKTVVNKLDLITSEYRVLDAELLAGEPNFITEVIEHGIRYKLDFSKVFWNSRLNTVHDKIVRKFDNKSVVFDVFSGIGPFILPAVKHRSVIKAFANDLNPSCIEFLRENMLLNKIPSDRIELFTLDGVEFIRQIIPKKFKEICIQYEGIPNFHCVMNLPGLSIEFLTHFHGIFKDEKSIEFARNYPFWIHCHYFVKADSDMPTDWFDAQAERMIHEKISSPALKISELRSTRSVAGRKEMYCATFLLPSDFSICKNVSTTNNDCALYGDSPPSKISRIDE